MKIWKNYSLKKTIIFGFFMIMLFLSTPILALFMPEFLLMIDIGGLELTVSFIILYFKPVISKYNQFLNSLKTSIQIIQYSFKNSLLIKSNYLIKHQTISVFIMFFTGSIVLSLFVFMPALYLGGINQWCI